MPDIVQNGRQIENRLPNVGVGGFYMFTADVPRGTTVLPFGPLEHKILAEGNVPPYCHSRCKVLHPNTTSISVFYKK